LKKRLKYSLFSFVALLAVVSLEAPVLASYSQQNVNIFSEEIESIWKGDPVGLSIFLERTEKRLPHFEQSFRQSSKNLDVHWTLIAAISYQESHWNPKAISDTGVRGMMMLTQKTAKEMGIKRRTNAKQSIFGGANYFQKNLNRLPIEIPKQDRIWMALAGYNLGFVNINLARKLALKSGGNPNLWSDVSIYLAEILIDRYADENNNFEKHIQALEYVERIQLYYQTLSILNREKEMLLLAAN
tara:strand:+ start:11560 stop:12288 length:729 start_codon:yes stop_codon:yes gene_type:complete